MPKKTKKNTKRPTKPTQAGRLRKAVANVIIGLIIVLVVSIIAYVSYVLGKNEVVSEQGTSKEKIVDANDGQYERLRQTLKEAQNDVARIKNSTHPLVSKSSKPIAVAPVKIGVKTPKKHKPKLAIILDDVSFEHEVREVHSLHIKVNFSFFPVTKSHPLTAKMASREPFYMVHLPLEAANFHHEEPETLRVTDSADKIQQRLQRIKNDFPRVHFLNNHTGSTFTANEAAVKHLLQATNALDLEMVDSRTTAQTKMPEVYKRYHKHLFSRNIFLDHESGVGYICKQMDKAVAYAKEHGKAIAIGHPRRTTIQALRKCKKKLDAVELVYLKDL